MSEHAARSALARMNLRQAAIAPHYTGLLSDLRSLATAKPDEQEPLAAARRGELLMAYGMAPTEQKKPYAFANGVAVIPVHGTLINRFGASWGYVTGYNFIQRMTAMAGQDSDVVGIVYDINSYGGEAAGCFECSADLRKLAGGKPTLAVVDSNAYSAAYALASGADRIAVTPSGGAGSIGVVTMHVDMSKMLEEWGIKVTYIYAGKHKVDGNPYEELPDSVRADIQKEVNKAYGAFVSLVAENRKMDEKKVRATEAQIFMADEALSLGLIDAIATPSQAVTAFLGELSGSNSQPRKKEDDMSAATQPGADSKATEIDVNAAKAEAAKAERARIAGIKGCEEAKGREALASHLALNTDMPVEDAKGILAASPKADAPAATGNAFKAAMDSGKHPQVGADAGPQADSDNPAANIVALALQAGVRGFNKAA